MTNKVKTKTKILNAAEQLFATTGFAETSMREITSKAGVNLASVNYHFGSKNKLMQAVLDRYLEVFFPALLKEIETAKQQEQMTVKSLFDCFKSPLLQLQEVSELGSVYFMQLLGRGYIDFQGHLRTFITGKYGKELQQVIDTFQEVNTDLKPEQIFWRLHLSLGTATFTLAASKALMDIAEKDYHMQPSVELIVQNLIPYIAAGFANYDQ